MPDATSSGELYVSWINDYKKEIESLRADNERLKGEVDGVSATLRDESIPDDDDLPTRLTCLIQKYEKEISRLNAMVDRWKPDDGTIQRLCARVEELEGLLAESGPLAWIHNQDNDGAQAWEKRVSKALKAGTDA